MSSLGRAGLGLALVLAFGTTRAAVEIELGVPAEPRVSVSPTETAGRYVVTWDQGERVLARAIAGDVVGDARRLFPGPPAPGGSGVSPYDYSRHAAAYKTARGRLLTVAQAAITPTLITEYSLELAVFDADLGQIARRYFSLPGLRPVVWETELALAADDWDDDCCALLAYVDKRTPGGGIVLERLDDAGVRIGEAMRIPMPGSDRVPSNPVIVYQRDSDHFLLVYETRADIRARVIPAVSGAPRDEVVVANKLRTARTEALVDGRPAVAYSPLLDRYLIAWYDHADAASRVRAVRAAFLDRSGRTPSAAFSVRHPCAFPDLTCTLQPAAAGAPKVLDAGQTFDVVFPAQPWNTPEGSSQIAGYRVWAASTATPQIRWMSTTPGDGPHRSRVAAARQSPLEPGLMVYRESWIDPLWTVHSLYGIPY